MVVGEFIFFTSIGLLSIFGNFLIIVVIWKTKEFRHSQYVFKFSIAISDIVWALFLCFTATNNFFDYFITKYVHIRLECQPYKLSDSFLIDKSHDVKHFSCSLTLPSGTSLMLYFTLFVNVNFLFMKISLIVTLVSLVFAAGDRYFAIAFPFRYKKHNTIKIAKVLSKVIWLLSTVVTFFTDFCEIKFKRITVLLQPFSCKNQNHIFNAIFLFVLFSLLWMFTFLTLKSVYESYKRSLKLNRAVRTRFLAEKQMSLVLIFMVAAFTLSLSSTLYNHIRFYVLKLVYSVCNDDEINLNAYISTYFLSTISVWNIFIYNVINKKFRLAFKALFKPGIAKPRPARQLRPLKPETTVRRATC